MASKKPFLEALRAEIDAAGDDSRALRQIAKVLLAQAKFGDMAAIKEIGDRLDGKPLAAIEQTTVEHHKFVIAPEKASRDEWLDDIAKMERGEPYKSKGTN